MLRLHVISLAFRQQSTTTSGRPRLVSKRHFTTFLPSLTNWKRPLFDSLSLPTVFVFLECRAVLLQLSPLQPTIYSYGTPRDSVLSTRYTALSQLVLPVYLPLVASAVFLRNQVSTRAPSQIHPSVLLSSLNEEVSGKTTT